MQNRLEAADGY